MPKSPDEIVAEAVRIGKEFEEKLAKLDRERREIIERTVKGAETKKIGVVRELIQRLFQRNQGV